MRHGHHVLGRGRATAICWRSHRGVAGTPVTVPGVGALRRGRLATWRPSATSRAVSLVAPGFVVPVTSGGVGDGLNSICPRGRWTPWPARGRRRASVRDPSRSAALAGRRGLSTRPSRCWPHRRVDRLRGHRVRGDPDHQRQLVPALRAVGSPRARWTARSARRSGHPELRHAVGTLAFSDTTGGWDARCPGDCIGLVIDSRWSSTQMVLGFGTGYVWPLLADGDAYSESLVCSGPPIRAPPPSTRPRPPLHRLGGRLGYGWGEPTDGDRQGPEPRVPNPDAGRRSVVRRRATRATLSRPPNWRSPTSRPAGRPASRGTASVSS